jgi:hypothetical protein
MTTQPIGSKQTNGNSKLFANNTEQQQLIPAALGAAVDRYEKNSCVLLAFCKVPLKPKITDLDVY